MNQIDIIQALLFNSTEMSEDQIVGQCKLLPNKIIRWLGAHHPDNQTRKIFYKITGVDIGEGTVINSNFIVSDGYASLLKIGERVAISPNVTVICESNPNNSILSDNIYVSQNLIQRNPVVIEDDVWIGANVTILPGVTIGKESIVGAGSVVINNVPQNSIVAGVPAQVVRNLRKPKGTN